MDAAKRRVARTGLVEVVADAPIEPAWRLIADVTRTGEWSHECRHVAWSRMCEILTIDAPRQNTWRTIPTPLFVDSTDWHISLEPVGAGTRIVQTFQVTRCPRWWEWIVARANPRHIDRSAALAEDLHRIGTVAAADTRRNRQGTKTTRDDSSAAVTNPG